MYYRKYFEGTVDATTTTTQYYMGLDKVATGTSMRTGHIKNRSDVIGNALVSTLKDIGYPNAYWDSTSGYLFFDKSNGLAGIYISVQSSTCYMGNGYIYSGYPYVYGYAGSYSTPQYGIYNWGSTSASPFSTTGATAATYAFCVTVKGEPKGIMTIHIGTYDNHSYEKSAYFHVVRGTDKRDNSSLIGFNFNGISYSFFVVNYKTVTQIASDSVFGNTNSVLKMNGELVVLIQAFMQYGYVFLDNTYFNPGISTAGFYEIDGDTYYVQSYWMTKCITTI